MRKDIGWEAMGRNRDKDVESLRQKTGVILGEPGTGFVDFFVKNK